MFRKLDELEKIKRKDTRGSSNSRTGQESLAADYADIEKEGSTMENLQVRKGACPGSSATIGSGIKEFNAAHDRTHLPERSGAGPVPDL
jgi:hypothetical protein